MLVLTGFFFTFPGEIENARLKISLAIPTGALITVSDDAMKMLPLVSDKKNKLKTYQNSQKKQYITELFVH